MPDIAPPPTHMMFDGPQTLEEFNGNGREYLRLYKDLAGLQPHESMLDVGSGIGRKTIPLAYYLTGRYEGIDCNKMGVQWCQENITSAYPNFWFRHVDIYAPGYNPTGTVRPELFMFPFDDYEFDFVTLNSVFTHMLVPGIEHYLDEIWRVLRPGGRALITWFLVDKSIKMAPPGFPHRHPVGWVANWAFPEQAIAFDLDWALGACYAAQFQVTQIGIGTWSGAEGLTYQDITILRKENK